MRERALTIGELLLQMKRQLARGVFTAWVRSACGLNMRTAENYMLAYAVTQIHPVLRDTKKFNLDSLYQLGRIANSDERRAELREIFLNRPLDTPAAVIAELKMKLAPSDASYRTLPAVADHTPSISHDQQIEPSIIVELAGALGNRLPDLVDLVRDHGAIAVCDALIAFHRDSLDNESLSFLAER